MGAFMHVMDLKTPLFTICLWLLNFSTIVFEIPPKSLVYFPKVNAYQDFLIRHAGFLRTVMARGVCYLLQGILWIIIGKDRLFLVILGVYIILVGCFHCAMHVNCLPKQTVRKL